MIDFRQVTLTKDDVRRVRIQNYKAVDAEKWASQLVIDLNTNELETRESIRILLTKEQQKALYKSLKKALNK
jgi:3'-phosphoadenosine 5'-phosphosulfate sulfotransferase